ncbi:MAG: polymer-forming cytoskeletal protein [Candidatus Eisenbacteria bacterium]|uniref:Polymer-forming cytoskeletal protein n=1 Tax=Eiseniibacteriota bacterium TaxID=2212470 RepID=A0A849SLN9_UNCEI|nr:polymer-forming cytoskeletal protein [Candidatus Eisenbacteria bacterium]
MRNAARVTAAILALGTALVLGLGVDATLAPEALAQNPLRFRSVPEESSSAFRQRQRARIVKPSSSTSSSSSARVAPAAGATRAEPDPEAVLAEPTIPSPPSEPEAPAVPTTGDMVRMGSDITIEKGEVVDGDVLTFGGNIKVYGQVRGNVSATGGDVFLGSSARIDGDVLCMGGKLEEESGAYVGGQRVTGLQSRHSRSERAKRVRIDRDWDGDRDRDSEHGATTTIVRRLTYLLFWLLVAWVATRFAPRRTRGAIESLRREPGMSFGLGFGMALLLAPSLIALAIAMVILVVTIIGIPVAIGAFFTYIALIILVAGWGYVVGAAALGERVAANRGQAAPTLLRSAITGIVIIQGAMLVSEMLHHMPLLGWIGGILWVLAMVAYSGVALLGIGAIVRSKFGQGEGGQWWPPARLFGSLSPAGPSYGGPVPPPPSGAPAAPSAPIAPAAPSAPFDPTAAPGSARTSPGYSEQAAPQAPAVAPPPVAPPPPAPPSSYMPPSPGPQEYPAPPLPPAPPVPPVPPAPPPPIG